MDGVLYHANVVLPGIKQFVEWLQSEKKHYLFLTNASDIGRGELSAKLQRMIGVTVSTCLLKILFSLDP